MNTNEWAKEHLEPPIDRKVHEILMDVTLKPLIDGLVDILDCTRYRAGTIVQRGIRTGYRF